MSSIDRLSILGIRSFGAEDKDKADIKFLSPLTLILGQNGCGKTTIIEALKYGTCGELPAGTEGGSGFVHDPKLSGLIESKGQVKLRFKSMKGGEFTISRSVQVTQKAKRLEFKTLESVIDVDKSNLSSRCGSVDVVACSLLGVSKAMLTNVIFCHQEDSAWPLDKGKKVKEKFDAIFGITEYNKCLDHIRQLTKDTNTEKVLIEKDVESCEIYRKEAKNKTIGLNDMKTKLAACQDNVTSMESQMRPLLSKYNEIESKEVNLAKFYAEVKTNESKRDYLIEYHNDLKNQIKTLFFGTKEELKEKLNQFPENLRESERTLKNLEKNKEEICTNETRIQKMINGQQMTFGQLQRDDECNEENVKSRNRYVNNLAEDIGLSAFSNSQLNEMSDEEMLVGINNKIKEYAKRNDKLQEEQEMKEKALQCEIDECRETKAKLEQEEKALQKRIRENKSETINIDREIKQVDQSANTLARLKVRLERVSKDIEEKTESLDTNELKNKMKNDVVERNRLEESLNSLDEEVKLLQLTSTDRAELNRLDDERVKLQVDVAKVKREHKDTLTHLFNGIPESGLHRMVQDRIEKLESEIKKIQMEISTREKQLSTLNANKKNLSEKLKDKQRLVSRDEDAIFDAVGQEDFNKSLQDISVKIQDAQDQRGTLSSSEFLFKRYVQKLQLTDPVCPTCHRGFDNEADVQTLVDDLTKRLKDLPARLDHSKSELDGLLERQSRLLQLKPTYENISKIRDVEIPKIKAELERVDNEILKLTTEINEYNEKLLRPQKDNQMAKSIQSESLMMDHNHSELKKISNQIVQLEEKIENAGVSNRTLNDALYEQQQLKSKIAEIRKTIENDQYRLSDHNDKLHVLKEQKNQIVSEQLKIEAGAQQRKSLTDKKEELETLLSVMCVELDEATEKLQPTARKLNEKIRQLDQIKNENKIAMDKGKKELADLERKLGDIKKLQQTISNYEKRGGKNSLNAAKEKLASLQKEKDRLSEAKKKIEIEIEEIKNKITNQKFLEEDLQNNLKFMVQKEEIEKVKLQIESAKGQLGSVDITKLSEEKNKIGAKYDKLKNEKAHAQGRLTELQEAVRVMERELNKPEFRDAGEKYRRTAISLKVKTKVIDDLRKYYTAMDMAMIHFHKERMVMINTIIRQLWREIYRGNDIDTVEIRTEESQTTTDKRRSYNYNVVQVKNGVELSMPGRCSAGQKVLACLIIRMALAETFSKNCGILALDEPTTNLDRENIESLSAALAEIVNSKSKQKNFQLVVITHDADFLNTLMRNERVDYYLEVTRNIRGKSVVKRVSAK